MATTARLAADAPAYEKVRDLAKGGMGQVELVVRRQGSFARAYARKRLLAHFAEDLEIRGMFLEEARVAGLIRHANTVPVLDVGEDEVGPYLVMDFIAGVDAGDFVRGCLRAGEQVPIAAALEIVRQAAEGLHAVHTARGAGGQALSLVHRDVTPGNILLGFDGCVRVADFGVARALDRVGQTRPGVLKGKAGYMSPEQLRFETLDHRSDLFSLGVVLFELLAGRRLYGGGMQVAAPRILREPPPDVAEFRAGAPPELVDLMYRLLAKDPAARPESARAVAEAVGAIAQAFDRVPLASLFDQHFQQTRADIAKMVDEALEHTETRLAPAAEPSPTDTHLAAAAEPTSAAPEPPLPAERRSGVVWGIALGAVALIVAGWMVLREDGAEPVLQSPESTVTETSGDVQLDLAEPSETIGAAPAETAAFADTPGAPVEPTQPSSEAMHSARTASRSMRMVATPMERETTMETAPTMAQVSPTMATQDTAMAGDTSMATQVNSTMATQDTAMAGDTEMAANTAMAEGHSMQTEMATTRARPVWTEY